MPEAGILVPRNETKKETAAPAISFDENRQCPPAASATGAQAACYRAGGGVAVRTHSE